MQGVSIYKDGRFNDKFLLFNDMIPLKVITARCALSMVAASVGNFSEFGGS